MWSILFQALDNLHFVVLTIMIALCASVSGATENQTVTAFDPSIIYGGSWKTNGSHGINHKNSKSGGAFANYTFQGSAIYYTGEISSRASAVEIIIDSVSRSLLNISHQAHAKGMKTSASDVEILFSAEDLDSQSMHTFTLKDYEDDKSEKFMTLYRLTVTTGSSNGSSNDNSTDTHNQATETTTPQMYGMEMSSGNTASHKRVSIGATLGALFGVAVVVSSGILIFRRRRKDMHSQSILQSVTPFIVQSYWWRVAAGRRLSKLDAPEWKRTGLVPRANTESLTRTQAPQPDVVEVQASVAAREPPPEYFV